MAGKSGAFSAAGAPRSGRRSPIRQILSVEPQPFGGEIVEPPPQQPVEGQNVEAQHSDPESDAGGVALGRPARDVGADAGSAQGRIAPLHDLRDDAAFPHPAPPAPPARASSPQT